MNNIDNIILRSSTSLHLRLTIHPDGRVVVSVPKHAKPADIERFVRQKEKWIAAKLLYFKKWRQKHRKRKMQSLQLEEDLSRKYGDMSGAFCLKNGIDKQYLLHKEPVLRFVHQRLAHWKAVYEGLGHNVSYARVSVKNQKTRWGSCSRHKDGTGQIEYRLNFNWRIALLPARMADYIIVHELCHLKELNHGVRFWKLVSLCEPHYAEVRGDLRKLSLLGVG